MGCGVDDLMSFGLGVVSIVVVVAAVGRVLRVVVRSVNWIHVIHPMFQPLPISKMMECPMT